MDPSFCLDRERLAGYLLGTLPEAEADVVAEHLDACAACEVTVRSMDHVTDTVIAGLRRPRSDNQYLQEPEYHHARLVLGTLAAREETAALPGSAVTAAVPPETLETLDDYQLLAKLGEGGMGAVYKARQVRLDKIVALKVLSNGGTADPMAQARFDREMKAVGRVDHPNIVRAMDAREIEGRLVLVMEYVEGVDLAGLGHRYGQLPIPDACEMVRQAALGLQSVDEQGLVHRDIKPSNLMLTGSGTIKILDLGLALLQTTQTPGEEMTGSGQPMGTAEYMAPEQVSDAHAVDIRADIYSLGCTLYRLLGGEVPFGGPEYKTAFDKMLAHLQKPVRSIRVLRPDVPDALAAVLDRMLAKSPDDRYATPAEVAQAIAPFSAGCNLQRLLGDPGEAGADAVTSPYLSSPGTGTADPLAAGEKVSLKVRGEEAARQFTPHSAALQEAAGVGLNALPAGRGRRRVRGPALAVALLLAAAGIVSVFTILIHIRDKKGHETTIEVADDSQIRIEHKRSASGATTTPSVMPGLSIPAMKGPGSHVPVGARPAGREKPFVVVRKGAETGEFKTFSGLWDVCQPGDEILVYGNGPFPLGPITVHNRALVLKAGAGFRPVFHRDESSMPTNQGWITLQGGALDVEGCDFVTRELPWQRRSGFLRGQASGPCVLRNCRIDGTFSYFQEVETKSLTIENCMLLFHNGIGVVSAGCQVTLTNNVLCTGANNQLLAYFRAPGGQTLRLVHNAIVFPTCKHNETSCFLLQGRADVKGVTIVAEGNLMDLNGGERGCGLPIAQDEFSRRLRWQGKENWYAGLAKVPTGLQGIAGWNSLLAEPEVNSHDLPEIPFAWSTDVPRDVKEATSWWQSRLAEARATSELADLGPDLSLVGPGEAYVRGLAAEGRPVPKDQLRPEPLSGGPIVLMHRGQDRGFAKLGDAFAAAADGDIIEIRADRPLDGAATGANRHALTLRAGAGYRPAIQKGGIHVQAGTVLAIEGLHFLRDGGLETEWQDGLPQDKQGRICRLAYCAFDPSKDPSNNHYNITCLLLGKGGSPGEMVRCLLLRNMEFQVGKGTRAHIRQCAVVGKVRWLGKGKSPEERAKSYGAFDLEACAIAWPKSGEWMWSYCGYNLLWASNYNLDVNKSSWAVRRCYFETSDQLLAFENHDTPWTGGRNCYRVGGVWVDTSHIMNLCDFRAAQKVPEIGSVEEPPPLADPQTWRLPADCAAHVAGPDLSRVCRTEPASGAAATP